MYIYQLLTDQEQLKSKHLIQHITIYNTVLHIVYVHKDIWKSGQRKITRSNEELLLDINSILRKSNFYGVVVISSILPPNLNSKFTFKNAL